MHYLQQQIRNYSGISWISGKLGRDRDDTLVRIKA